MRAMYLPASEHPLAAALEAHWLGIRDEMRSLPRPGYEPIADGLIATGQWRGLGIHDALDPARANRWRDNTAACPFTCAILARIQGLQVAGFLWMAPGTRLLPHADMQEPRFLNFMLALEGGDAAWMRVGTERRRHIDGKCVVFDPRLEHEAGNDGAGNRITMYAAVGWASARLPFQRTSQPS